MGLTIVLNFLKRYLTKKRLITLIVISIAAFSIFTFTQRSRQKPVEFTEVKRQDISEVTSASGVLAGEETVNLRFKAPGKLVFLDVRTTDRVFAGQTIASLDTAELTVTLQQAQNNLREKEAALDKIIDDINLFQYGNGGSFNVGSPNETMTQRSQRTTAEVAKDNAYDSVKAAERAFQDAIIVSPIAGLIIKSDVSIGQTVSPTDLIAQVVDTSELYFDAEVDEADISKIKRGQQAKVTLNAHPDKEFLGKVSQIKPTTKTASSGATVIIVRILLEYPGIGFIADLNGQAEIEVGESKNVLTIPQDALVEDNFVYIQTAKGYEKKEVKTGLSTDIDIEIREGLSENQKIVKNPDNIP